MYNRNGVNPEVTLNLVILGTCSYLSPFIIQMRVLVFMRHENYLRYTEGVQ